VPGELALLDGWEAGDAPPVAESRVVRLDSECRLAAFEPQVCPSSLLLLQALLAAPPASWKKHSLPALARQVRKLLSEANARMQERQSLARLTTWGNTAAPPRAAGERPAADTTLYTTAREVVTPTGTLSEKETELVECFEAVQRWQQQRMALAPAAGAALSCEPLAAAAAAAAVSEGGGEEHIARMQRFVIGASPSEHDGRIAFLLAFGSAVELEVSSGDEGEKETLSVLFCGDAAEPLLVQRIGKARDAAAAEGPASGESGAKAVPSLGYVRRHSGQEVDRLLVEAAERAVAEHWARGKTVALPLPPPGLQWALDAAPGEEEAAERVVKLTATLGAGGGWSFSIAGREVEAFDARAVIAPCSLDLKNHKPLELDPGGERASLLRVALYAPDEAATLPSGEAVLRVMQALHAYAAEARRLGAQEGLVHDWLPLGTF